MSEKPKLEPTTGEIYILCDECQKKIKTQGVKEISVRLVQLFIDAIEKEARHIQDSEDFEKAEASRRAFRDLIEGIKTRVWINALHAADPLGDYGEGEGP
jgi:hypothetical protein